MTFDEFIKKYTNVAVDFDGYYGTQCMDLMHQYVYDVLNIKDKTVLAAQYAKLVWEQFKWGELFDIIPNTLYGVPVRGDIIVWGGEYGHIAIFVEGDVNSFSSFDANYPLGTLPHIQYHNYDNVLGWLRLKEVNEMNTRFSLTATDKSKILRGALLATGGALITYLLETLPGVDFGANTAAIVAVVSVLLNALRKFLSNTS